MGILLVLVMMFFFAPPAVAGGNSAIVWNNRGVDLYSAGKYQAAIGAYNKAIQINPRYTDAYSNRGVAYDALDQPERAVQDYSKAIELNPGLTASWVNRGLAYTDLAKFKEAIADWNVVLKRSPRNADAYYRRGFCYQSSGSLDKALNDYERATKLNPRMAKATKARDMMRKALAITPANNANAQENSFTPLPMEKIPATAVSDPGSKVAKPIEHALPDTDVPPPRVVATSSPPVTAVPVVEPRRQQVAPVGPAAYCVSVLYHVVGNACSAVGQHDAAANWFSGALNVNPNDEFAYFRRASAMEKAGKREQARADYASAASIAPNFKQAQLKSEGRL
jgi:tetratricopeptide (TPR) repeat protein